MNFGRWPAVVLALVLAQALFASCVGPPAAGSTVTAASEFSDPRRVAIRGYDGDAMEPFLSRDGRYLFFNNSNDSKVNTNLYWAERVDDLTFQYKGEIAGVNTPALDAVASMDRNGIFFFVTTRSYKQTSSTLYRGSFSDGVVSGIELVPGVSLAKAGIVNFDAEISADGDTLYFVESEFSIFGKPKYARILMARREGNAFRRPSDGAFMLQEVNAGGFSYAPATSASELEIFFTRFDGKMPAIFFATRLSRSAPFGMARKIEAIDGFAEGPTLSPDGKALYYHKREGKRFVLYRVTRR
jgi:Tol biopolymer transport system component